MQSLKKFILFTVITLGLLAGCTSLITAPLNVAGNVVTNPKN